MTTFFHTLLKQAEKLDDKELARHAAVGRICKCRGCFCCAAEDTRVVRDVFARNDRRLKIS